MGTIAVRGRTLIDLNTGSPIYLQGVCQGAYLEDQPFDASRWRAMGANCVRIVAPRWWGVYGPGQFGDGIIESRDDAATATALVKPANWAETARMLTEARNAGLKTILAIDSNCGQSGEQNADTITYCTIGGNPGQNFWNNLSQRALFLNIWQYAIQNYGPLIDICELLPEPLEGRDASFAQPVRDFYAEVADRVLAFDPNAVFLIGPRQGYDISLAAEAHIPGRFNIIYTGNILNGVMSNTDTLPDRVKALLDLRDAQNVPVLVQQVGRRTSSDNGALAILHSGLAYLASEGVHYTYWQTRQNTAQAGEYALYYKDGVGGWIAKANEIAAMAYQFATNRDSVEADALAAAAAAGATLFYVKSDLSNVYQDAGGITPGAVGQPVGRIAAVVGTGDLAQSNSTLRPTLVQHPADTRVFGWQGDSADDFLQMTTLPFAPGSDHVVIAAGYVGAASAIRVLFHNGNSTAVARDPMISITAADNVSVSWRGDDNVLQEIVGTHTYDNTPAVISAEKVGAAKTAYVNGLIETGANATPVGTIATITRARSGANNSGGANFTGRLVLLCTAVRMTAPQRLAIERFAAYLAKAPYTEGAPASRFAAARPAGRRRRRG